MAKYTKIVFEDAGGAGEDITLRMSEEAIEQLGMALSILRVPIATRRAILSGKRKAPFMLYTRFHKMMRNELGESPIVKTSETIAVEPIRPTETHRVVGGRTRKAPPRKTGRARAAALSVGEQIEVKRERKRRIESEGRPYRDVLPTFVGPATGRRKGESTGNIFATGTHRGTSYLIEEIAPGYWQAKVTKHPWTVGARGAAREFMGAGGAGRTGRRGFMVGDLMGHEFPVFEGPNGWKEAQRDVESAIDRSYEYRVETGNIPPELEKYVSKEIGQTRRGGRTPSLAPSRRKKNPRKKVKKKATKNAKKPKLPATGTLPAAGKKMYKAIFDSSYKYYKTERGATEAQAEEIAARTAWDEVERYYYKRAGKWVKRKTPKPQKTRPHDIKLPNSRNPRNPTAEVHQEMGEGFLSESEKLWDGYCKTGSAKTLLDAYRVLELACQEFEYTGDKKRMKQAKEGIKAARAEIMAGMKSAKKKPTKKKSSKKRSKK